jgi:hypothetical protein
MINISFCLLSKNLEVWDSAILSVTDISVKVYLVI